MGHGKACPSRIFFVLNLFFRAGVLMLTLVPTRRSRVPPLNPARQLSEGVWRLSISKALRFSLPLNSATRGRE
jgi:hypothetical protein